MDVVVASKGCKRIGLVFLAIFTSFAIFAVGFYCGVGHKVVKVAKIVRILWPRRLQSFIVQSNQGVLMYKVQTPPTDLMALIEQDCGQGRRSGRWWRFHCPFPGHTHGDRNPSLSVTPDNGRWYCFTCHRSGDAVDWLIQHRGLSYQEAVKFYKGSLSAVQEYPRTVTAIHKNQPDVEFWQKRGMTFIADAEATLWGSQGQGALEYLHKRGLTDTTINRYRLGLMLPEKYESAELWGFFDNSKKIWFPRGIIIPNIVRGFLWSIKIRRPAGDPRYIHVRGSKNSLYGAANLIGADFGLLCKGEFDCMLADQEIGDAIGVATLGSANQKLDLLTWGPYLMRLRKFFIAYDIDAARDIGANNLTRLGSKLIRIRLPEGPWKDVTDFFLAGGDIWNWVKEYISLPAAWDRENLVDSLYSLGDVVTKIIDENQIPPSHRLIGRV